MTVLIVDDSQEMRQLIIDMQDDIEEIDNLVVHEAEDGFEGLIQFVRVTLDLVIINYEIPGMNGLMFSQQLRKKDDNVHIILNSGDFYDGEHLGLVKLFSSKEANTSGSAYRCC